MGAIANYYRTIEDYIKAIDQTLTNLAEVLGVPKEVFDL